MQRAGAQRRTTSTRCRPSWTTTTCGRRRAERRRSCGTSRGPRSCRRALADEDADIFSVIRSGDVLVHHPTRASTASVERFIKAGRRRPEGAGDQDDALPHRRRQPVHPHAHPRRRGRQAGRRAWSSSRPASTRSATSSSPTRWKRPACTWCTASSGSRRTRKTTLVVRAGRRRHPLLRPHRHRQLPRRHRPALHRPGPVHLRPGHHRTTWSSCSTTSPAGRSSATTASCWWRR